MPFQDNTIDYIYFLVYKETYDYKRNLQISNLNKHLPLPETQHNGIQATGEHA